MPKILTLDEQMAAKATLPLIDSQRRETGLRGLRSRLFGESIGLVIKPVPAGLDHGLPNPALFHPYPNSKRYGTTHYGIMISDLPAPHYFLACASMLGSPSIRAFDVDAAVHGKDGPRNTVILSHGTAAAAEGAFSRYSLRDDMTIKDDGSLLRFGDDLEISGLYPHYRLKSQRDGFSVDLALTATGEITWFAKGWAYDHLGLMTRYKGTIRHEGKTTEVSGLCTYEYARGITPYSFYNRLMPGGVKIPWDVFSYQVINLDADTQLLLAHCSVLGHNSLTSAYIREAGKAAWRIEGDVHFKVNGLQSTPAIDPAGNVTLLPDSFTWEVLDPNGNRLFEVNADVDTPMVFGLGMGYIGGFRWHGTRDGQPAEGRGYWEYVDQRQD